MLTKPEANVNIMLCTIEENRAKSLRGTSFEKDLRNYGKTSHLCSPLLKNSIQQRGRSLEDSGKITSAAQATDARQIRTTVHHSLSRF